MLRYWICRHCGDAGTQDASDSLLSIASCPSCGKDTDRTESKKANEVFGNCEDLKRHRKNLAGRNNLLVAALRRARRERVGHSSCVPGCLACQIDSALKSEG